MMKVEGLCIGRGHLPQVAKDWDGNPPVQVTARVSFNPDWELQLGGDGKYLYSNSNCPLARCDKNPKRTVEVKSNDDFSLAITWMEDSSEKFNHLGIRPCSEQTRPSKKKGKKHQHLAAFLAEMGEQPLALSTLTRPSRSPAFFVCSTVAMDGP